MREGVVGTLYIHQRGLYTMDVLMILNVPTHVRNTLPNR